MRLPKREDGADEWKNELHGEPGVPDHRPWINEQRSKRDSVLSNYSGFGSTYSFGGDFEESESGTANGAIDEANGTTVTLKDALQHVEDAATTIQAAFRGHKSRRESQAEPVRLGIRKAYEDLVAKSDGGTVTLASIVRSFEVSGAYLTNSNRQNIIAESAISAHAASNHVDLRNFDKLYTWSADQSNQNSLDFYNKLPKYDNEQPGLVELRKAAVTELGIDLPPASIVTLFGGNEPDSVRPADMSWLLPALLQTQRMRLVGLFTSVVDSNTDPEFAQVDQIKSLLKSHGYSFSDQEFTLLSSGMHTNGMLNTEQFIRLYTIMVKAWQTRPQTPAVKTSPSTQSSNRMSRVYSSGQSLGLAAINAERDAALQEAAMKKHIAFPESMDLQAERQNGTLPLEPVDQLWAAGRLGFSSSRLENNMMTSSSDLQNLFIESCGSADGFLSQESFLEALDKAGMMFEEEVIAMAVTNAKAQNCFEEGYSLTQFLDISGELVAYSGDPTKTQSVTVKRVMVQNELNLPRPIPHDRGFLPKDQLENTRSERMGKRMWEVRKVNEQARGELAGVQTNVTIESEEIQRTQNSQRYASKVVNPQSHGGKFERSGAEISYYHKDFDRFKQPVTMLDYDDTPATWSAVDDPDLSPYFHASCQNKAHAECTWSSFSLVLPCFPQFCRAKV